MCSTKAMGKYSLMIKTTLWLMGVIPLGLVVSIAQAQTNAPGGLSNTLQNSGFPSSPGQFNNIRPVRQQNFLIDSGSGSQQFFRRGREQLYLLPEEEPKPILQIDETIEAEGIDYQDLQNKPSDD